MDQDLQDLKKLNLVELEEKLHEINNNNRVSFNEYESESIDSPIKKKLIKLENHVVKKLIYQMKKYNKKKK